MSIYLFDLDQTLCSTKGGDYESSEPLRKRIEVINNLYEEGHTIRIFTSRYMTRCAGDVSKVYEAAYQMTKCQLSLWGIKHHDLILGKPSCDVIVDDKAVNDKDFFRDSGRVGVAAGNFDVLHPGYIKMFSEYKNHCDYLIIALHEDPSVERKEKSKPILSVQERSAALMALRAVDKVIPYKSEQDLFELLKNNKIDVRFLGEDYIGKRVTGTELGIPTVFSSRSHGWSSTKLKNLIIESKI